MDQKPKYRNSDWLRTQYIDRERTLIDIGEECGVSSVTILKWCRRFNIPRRNAGMRISWPKSRLTVRLSEEANVQLKWLYEKEGYDSLQEVVWDAIALLYSTAVVATVEEDRHAGS